MTSGLVVTVRPGARAEIRHLLLDLGPVSDTSRDNVLVLHVPEPLAALRMLKLWYRINPELRDKIDHAVPVTHSFEFETCEDFTDRASMAIRSLLPFLAGKSIRVRRDRHGVDNDEQCLPQEHELARILASESAEAEIAAEGNLGDADVTIALECIDHWVGLSLWTRQQLLRYPELGFLTGAPAA